MLRLPLLILLVIAGVDVRAERYTEADLDVLFTTPAARGAIDARRTDRSASGAAPQGKRPGTVRVDGVVRRSGGGSTVWVNGRSTLDGAPVSGVRVPGKQQREDAVTVYIDGERVRIKPGESWTENTNDK